MDASTRKVELESKIAFLERAVDELNGVILEQGRSIESLERKLEQLSSRLDGPPGDEGELDPADERPPHY